MPSRDRRRPRQPFLRHAGSVQAAAVRAGYLNRYKSSNAGPDRASKGISTGGAGERTGRLAFAFAVMSSPSRRSGVVATPLRMDMWGEVGRFGKQHGLGHLPRASLEPLAEGVRMLHRAAASAVEAKKSKPSISACRSTTTGCHPH
jgi:hypothetical protein